MSDTVHLLAWAEVIAEQLEREAIRNTRASGWFTVEQAQNREWQIQPAGFDLYSGLPGIILFLAYLDHVNGETRHRKLTRQAWSNLEWLLRQHKAEAFSTIGAFSGIAGSIYLSSHLGSLWDEDQILNVGRELAAEVPQHVRSDRLFDWIGGAAGCIVSLLSLYSVDQSSETLAAANACGERLLTSARRMPTGVGWISDYEDRALAGIAHGASGIALSLIKLANVTGDQRFRQAAASAIAYERTLFCKSERAWVDVRRSRVSHQVGSGEDHFATGWCNGAAGIGMSRSDMISSFPDEIMQEEISTALHVSAADAASRGFSLCHGIAGDLETLKIGCDDNRERDAAISRHLRALIRVAKDPELKPPGLMNGIAGIGYTFLRLAKPEVVPSVLLLNPPHTRAAR